jgi:hypothetical protein
MTEKKNPRRVKGAGCNHCGGDDDSPTRSHEKPRLKITIHIIKDGPLYRVRILPPQQLDGSIARADAYAGLVAARQSARWLSKATGWPVIDLTGR